MAPTPSGDSRFRMESSPQLLRLAREAARTLRVARVGIWVFSDDGVLSSLARYDRRLGAALECGPLSGELSQHFHALLERVASLAVPDTQRTRGGDPLSEWVKSEAIRAILLLPVRIENRIVGMITCEETGGVHQWTSRDRDLAAAVAHQIREALDVRPTSSPADRPTAKAIPQPYRATSSAHIDSHEDRDDFGQPGWVTAPAPSALPVAVASPPAAPVTDQLAERDSRRLSPLEGGAILAGEEANSVLWGLEVQMAYLRLLEEMLSDRPDELGFLREALEIGEGVTQGARSAVLLLREGMPAGTPIDLSSFLATMIPSLAAEAGKGIRLRIAPGSESLPIRGNAETLDRAFRYLVREARIALPASERVRISWGRVNPEGGARRERNGFLASEVARVRITYRGSVVAKPISGPLFVDAVIEAHGGWVERGFRGREETVVDLYLPLALPTLSHPHGNPNASLGERRILLIEDEPLLARLVERTLLRSGYRVEVASTAMEAERIWRHLDGAIDLIVADRSLTGGVSGAEVAHHLRGRLSDLPLVLLDRGEPLATEEGPSILESEAMTLRRPFEAADILRAVRGALRTSSATPPPAHSTAGTSEQAH